MKRFPLFTGLLLLLLEGLLTACQPPQKKMEVTEEKPVAPPVLAESADSQFYSFAEKLGEVSIRGTTVSPSDPLIPEDLKTPIAYMGAFKFLCQGKELLVWKRDTLSWPPQEGDNYGSEPLFRYRANERITAGPLVFQDVVLIATARPAFVILDRHDLTVQKTIPVDDFPLGPLTYDSEKKQISVFLGDGWRGIYTLQSGTGDITIKESVDPVDLLIKPAPQALSKIVSKTAQLLSKEGAFEFSRYAPYRPGLPVPPDTALLCRYEMNGGEQKSAGETIRLYVDGASERPYLIALFSDTGELMASNIEYAVAKVLEAPIDGHRPYFVAVSYLNFPETGSPVPSGRLVIGPKGP